jgi:predicted helicase
MEVIAITDKIQKKRDKPKGKTKHETGKGKSRHRPTRSRLCRQAMSSRICNSRSVKSSVPSTPSWCKKCGNRHHWEDWANDIAKIARTHIDRITGILENPANDKEQRSLQRLCARNCAMI